MDDTAAASDGLRRPGEADTTGRRGTERSGSGGGVEAMGGVAGARGDRGEALPGAGSVRV